VTPIIIAGGLLWLALMVAAYRKAKNHGEEKQGRQTQGRREEEGRRSHTIQA